jgi:DNA-binding MarR family transcriptional regulator
MEPHRAFFYEYTVMYRPYLNLLNNLLAPFQLYSSQWRIMHFILHHDPHTISDIANYQKVEKPTTTKMVQRLIELDYLEACPGMDKRTKVIQLTAKGHVICAQIEEKLSQLQNYLLEDVSEEEQLAATNILKKISERIVDYKG